MPPPSDGFRRSAGAGPSGDFDFYVLALSWSSGFCESGGAQRAKNQCRIGANLGFVVHGLWPQYDRGFPSDCDSARPVSRLVLESAAGIFPDDGLARYEWRKHGTCSGKSPQAYFADVRRARATIQVPAQFSQPQDDRRLAPSEIIGAFAALNKGLRPDMMAIVCKKQVLQEVRFCFSKDLRNFQSCPQVSRSTCRASEISVPKVY